jgi:hypothetical protein
MVPWSFFFPLHRQIFLRASEVPEIVQGGMKRVRTDGPEFMETQVGVAPTPDFNNMQSNNMYAPMNGMPLASGMSGPPLPVMPGNLQLAPGVPHSGMPNNMMPQAAYNGISGASQAMMPHVPNPHQHQPKPPTSSYETDMVGFITPSLCFICTPFFPCSLLLPCL